MPINKDGLKLIKAWEGIRDGNPKTVNLDPYLCPASVATIGWGHAITWNGAQLIGEPGLRKACEIYRRGITRDEAEALLRADVLHFERVVERLVTAPLSYNQYSALVAFTFNIGEGAFEKSALLKLLNQRKYAEAAEQFARWNKSGGRVLDGLTNRRAAEKKLFLKP
jgi:lysozyme